MIKVGDLVWVVSTQTTFFSPTPHPYAVDPGLITKVSDPTHPNPSTNKYEALVNGQKEEFYADNICESEQDAEKTAKELRRYSTGLKGNTYLDAGYVYAPYVPLEVTPKLAV